MRKNVTVKQLQKNYQSTDFTHIFRTYLFEKNFIYETDLV